MRFLNATNPHLGVHYPTLNVVHYLHRGEAVLSVGVCQTAEAHNFLDLGACLAEAVRRTPDARVALIGSGGMTHTFWPMDVILDHASFRPDDVISPEARAIDERVLGHWRDGDHAAVLDLYPEYRRFHPEGFFGHYLMLVGALGGRELPHPRPAALRLRERRRHGAGARMVRHRRLKADRTKERRMTLAGWTLPQTPTGRASTVPPPPWHYSGDIIAIDFTADPARVAELVPEGFSPRGDGSCTFFFCDWCSSADRDPRVKDDPAKGPVQGGLRDPQRNLRWPAVRARAVHLGRFRAFALARADPGLPEEARRNPHDARHRDREGWRAESGRRALRSPRLESRAATGDRRGDVARKRSPERCQRARCRRFIRGSGRRSQTISRPCTSSRWSR